MLLFLLVALGLAIGFAASAAGLLAPWWPALEMVNHFRPFAVAGATMLLIVALTLRSARLVAPAALLLAANLSLLLVPHLLYAAPAAPGNESQLRIAVLNTWVWKGQADRIQEFVEEFKPDIILLQEVGQTDREVLLERLAPSHPHALFDQGTRHGPALVSKWPWTEAGIVPTERDERRPLAVWARFERDRRTYVAASVHTANPFEWEHQPADIEQLVGFVRSHDVPVILGGDFNLTPFSWKLVKLAHRTGLRWAQTFAASWPANRFVPLVLLDHILVSEGLSVVDVAMGPRVGSDHLPVVADVSFAAAD